MQNDSRWAKTSVWSVRPSMIDEKHRVCIIGFDAVFGADDDAVVSVLVHGKPEQSCQKQRLNALQSLMACVKPKKKRRELLTGSAQRHRKSHLSFYRWLPSTGVPALRWAPSRTNPVRRLQTQPLWYARCTDPRAHGHVARTFSKRCAANGNSQ